MADESTIPLLPCSSIDVIGDFYAVLGFRPTFRQARPNPYLALQREDLHLHFFGLPNFIPEDSYGSCLVLVPDVEALYTAFAAGMRAAYGRVLVAGIPRMTRPRPKRNMGGTTGFSVVDPGGNWIRITTKAKTDGTTPPVGKLAVTLQNAVVQADSRGDYRQAGHILDGALARPHAADDLSTYVEALVYRAEIAMAVNDTATAREMLDRFDRVARTVEDRQHIATATFATASELAAALT